MSKAIQLYPPIYPEDTNPDAFKGVTVVKEIQGQTWGKSTVCKVTLLDLLSRKD